MWAQQLGTATDCFSFNTLGTVQLGASNPLHSSGEEQVLPQRLTEQKYDARIQCPKEMGKGKL